MPRFDAVLFDLDGTLLYTLPDIHAALCRALGICGHKANSLDETRAFVGSGSRALVARSLGEETPDEEIDRVLGHYRAQYKAALMVETVPYPGMEDALRSLHGAGVKLGVVTNKPHENAVPMIEHYFPGLFGVTEGSREGRAFKPEPAICFDAMRALGVEKERTLFVGDSDVDYLTAENAQLPCVLCAWGYRQREMLARFPALGLIDEPAALLKYIL